MPALSGPVKVFIVERLACFDKPVEVQQAVKREFKVDVTLPQLAAYNPTQASGARLSKTLREVFEATRKKFLEDTSSIAIAHRSYRLRMLDRMAEKMVDVGNVVVAAQLLEQAAKEEGGAFTNRQKHEHTGKDGGPIEMKHLTDAERASRVASIMARAKQRAQGGGEGGDAA